MGGRAGDGRGVDGRALFPFFVDGLVVNSGAGMSSRARTILLIGLIAIGISGLVALERSGLIGGPKSGYSAPRNGGAPAGTNDPALSRESGLLKLVVAQGDLIRERPPFLTRRRARGRGTPISPQATGRRRRP